MWTLLPIARFRLFYFILFFLPLGTSWKFSSSFTRDLGLLLFGLCLLSLLLRRYRLPLFDIRASPAGAGAVVRSLHFAGHRGPWGKVNGWLKTVWGPGCSPVPSSPQIHWGLRQAWCHKSKNACWWKDVCQGQIWRLSNPWSIRISNLV